MAGPALQLVLKVLLLQQASFAGQAGRVLHRQVAVGCCLHAAAASAAQWPLLRQLQGLLLLVVPVCGLRAASSQWLQQ
jgi:hypothetical protein